MKILISHTTKQPIYAQIQEQIEEAILKGTLLPQDSLPSMRELAKQLKVSVITTKRAYEELETRGLIYSIVGKGSFVAEANEQLNEERKKVALEEKVIETIVLAKELNMSKRECIELFNLLYEE